MKTTRALLALAAIAVTALVAIAGSPILAAITLFIAGHAISEWRPTNRFCVTLTAPEMLMDVIRAFRSRIPAAMLLGNEWRSTPLKYNGHIPLTSPAFRPPNQWPAHMLPRPVTSLATC
jgi:hypothetical protein